MRIDEWQMMTEEAPCVTNDSAGKRVVIVGGGYAGTTLAVRLGRALKRSRRTDGEVLLVETNPCQQALSELDLVAAGSERPEFCELWLPAVLKDLPVRTCFNRIQAIDTQARTVTTAGGHELSYWRLALCTGAIPSIPPVPGLAENALTMWSVADAQKLQRRIAEQFKQAARLPTGEARREALSVTVIGGGATGVEIVGTMGQLLPKRAAEIGLSRDDLRISLVEGRPDVLYDLPPQQRADAMRRLGKLGIGVFRGSMVERIDKDAVMLADGTRIPSSIVVWCGGAKADPDALKWGFSVDNVGRVHATQDCKSREHDDVYVLGDVASFVDPATNHTIPMLAQFAIQEAQHAAANVLRELDGLPTVPWHPHMHGEFVSVGPSWGVGWMWRLRLTGVAAILMKRLTYVMYWWQVGGVRLAWARGREVLSMQR